MRIIKFFLFIGMTLISIDAFAQYINMYDYEQKIFNNQLEAIKSRNPFILFGSDMIFGDNDKVGRILAIQAAIKGDGGREKRLPFSIKASTASFIGINSCMHLYKWWPPNQSFAFSGRNYLGEVLYLNKASFAGGFYLYIASHDAFEHLDYGISRAYVNKNPSIFKVKPFFAYKLDRRIRFDLTYILGNYLNSDLFFKLINRDVFQFIPGINYEETVVDTSLSEFKLKRISYKNIFAFPENTIYIKVSIGSFAEKGKDGNILNATLKDPQNHLYYLFESCFKGLLFGTWYRRDYGTGFYFGFGFDDFNSSKAYIKLKYNDGMLEPLYKNIKNIWSFSLNIYISGED